jgi:hypothetical protein
MIPTISIKHSLEHKEPTKTPWQQNLSG